MTQTEHLEHVTAFCRLVLDPNGIEIINVDLVDEKPEILVTAKTWDHLLEVLNIEDSRKDGERSTFAEAAYAGITLKSNWRIDREEAA